MALVQVTATLTDLSGNPIPNEPVDFSYKLTTDVQFISGGTAVTGPAGMATVSLDLPAGTYDITASFSGDMTVVPALLASSASVVYDIGMGITPSSKAGLIVVVVAASVVIGFAALRRRSR